ncbi:MAG TPA: MauE/DoxX family redox-associated membrane protein [Jatrophihabitans sp.]|nr:MauE/DoxX family redox-associated membrane protein [Jatrophihabitans sp.]
MPVIADWAATAMFVVFAVAVLAKLRSGSAFDDFAASLSQFGIRAIPAQRAVAVAVLLFETLACVGLVLWSDRPAARFALPVLLLVAFGAGVAVSARGGRSSACHCFGTATELPTGLHLALNGSLAAFGCLAALGGRSAGTTGDAVLGVGLGIISGVLFVFAADLYVALSTRGPADARRAMVEKGA